MTKAGNKTVLLFRALCWLLLPVFLWVGTGQLAGAAGTTTTDGDVSIEFQGGGLTLVSVPTFDFGRHPKPSADTYYAAQRIGPDPVTIQDLDGRGWKLMAKLTSTAGSALSGSTLHFNTDASHIKPGSGMGGSSIPPVASTCEIKCNSTAVEVCGTSVGRGNGLWTIDWQADSAKGARAGASTGSDVEIKILASNAKTGKAQAVLDWDLIVAP